MKGGVSIRHGAKAKRCSIEEECTNHVVNCALNMEQRSSDAATRDAQPMLIVSSANSNKSTLSLFGDVDTGERTEQ